MCSFLFVVVCLADPGVWAFVWNLVVRLGGLFVPFRFGGWSVPWVRGLGGRRRFRSLEVLEYGEALEDETIDGVATERDHEQVQVFGSRF